jgi:hypothetical protein
MRDKRASCVDRSTRASLSLKPVAAGADYEPARGASALKPAGELRRDRH